MELKRVTQYTESVFRDINALNVQLSSKGDGVTQENVKATLGDSNVHLVGLYDGDRVVGMATLTVLRIVGGAKGYLDDVVVDEAYRGKGLGKKLMLHMIELAKSLHLVAMEFTSKRARIEANKLYQAMGFLVKDSNAYQMKL